MRYFSILLITLFTTSFAYSHSWYDQDCCSKQDCFQVNFDEPYDDKNGNWYYKQYKFLPTMVRPSKDNNFHVCLQKNYMGTTYPRCIYIVQSY